MKHYESFGETLMLEIVELKKISVTLLEHWQNLWVSWSLSKKHCSRFVRAHK